MLRLVTFLIALTALPNLVEAVSINEVAWMGDSSSANHEWIELYHDGADIAVDGWVLSDGMNLSITLKGTITSGTFAVLERSNEESAPGSAFLVYTGALVNTGATLVLRDDLGNVVDQVAGGEGWSLIGGDNVTKETAQYTSGGWVTDVATPGAVNRSGRVEVVDDEDEDDDNQTDVDNDDSATNEADEDKESSGNNRVAEPPKKIKIEAPAVVFTHQAVTFTATTNQSSKAVRFNWNFGDSYSATGTAVTHRYQYPGTYIVNVEARIKGEDVVYEKEITVLPLALAIGKALDGSVQLHNNAPHDIDVSGYTLYAGRVVTFPPHTKIKARGTITIPRARLGGGEVRLVLDNGLVAPLTITQNSANDTEVKPKASLGGVVFTKAEASELTSGEKILIPAPESAANTPIKDRAEMMFLIILGLLVLLVLWLRPVSLVDDKVQA